VAHSHDQTTTTVPVGPGNTQPQLIFDVGLNIGQDTGFYLSQGYRVLAVEADPTLAQAARQKFAGYIRSGHLEVLNVGVAEVEGAAEFWICEAKPEFNSFHREIAARDSYPHHSIQVPTMRFSSIIERYGTPHFLKIDIEGNDMLCLDGLSSHSLPDYLSIESECPLDGETASLEDGLRVLRKLALLGYRQFKLIDQFTFCALSEPPEPHYRLDAIAQKTFGRPPIDRLRGLGLIGRHLLMRRKLERRFHHTFPMGSSGVWGEATPGKWIGLSEAEESYRSYRSKHFEYGKAKFHSFWCDWHAKL
jgi:FkbM family methyltransferase